MTQTSERQQFVGHGPRQGAIQARAPRAKGSPDSAPVVLTSLNPHKDYPAQAENFERWKQLGFETRSYNVNQEADRLLALGIPEGDIVRLDQQNTSFETNGKYLPRILPILENALQTSRAQHFLLTNSDIFPAFRSRDISEYWQKACASSLALTREECITPANRSFLASKPYRGGLDVFFFTRRALETVIRLLSELHSAPMMTMGLPGWDFLLAACIRHRRIDGRIMDSRVLLHRSHRTTYRSVESFSVFVPDMKRLGAVSVDSAVEAAGEFAALIDQDCEAHSLSSLHCKLSFFAPPTPQEAVGAAVSLRPEWLQLVEYCYPGFFRDQDLCAVAMLARRLSCERTPDINLCFSQFATATSVLFQFTQSLIAILFALKCRNPRRRFRVSTRYEAPRDHHKVMNQLLESRPWGDPSLRRDIAQLFGAELVEYGIFNERIYRYLLNASSNEHDVRTLEAIRNSVEYVRHAA